MRINNKIQSVFVLCLLSFTIILGSKNVQAQCIAVFTSNTTHALIPTHFLDLSTSSNGVINLWEWDFGDGGTSNLQNPTHIYLRGALQSLGTRLARFSPDGPRHDTRFPLIYQDRVEDGGTWPNYFRRVFTARTTGPVIEIYRVEAEALRR